MVKFRKNKLKVLNKLSKKQTSGTSPPSNKILKKKLNLERKVTFQKEVLIKETITEENALIKNVKAQEILAMGGLSKKPTGKEKPTDKTKKTTTKAVQKKKKRQLTQINDTKFLLKLMNKK